MYATKWKLGDADLSLPSPFPFSSQKDCELFHILSILLKQFFLPFPISVTVTIVFMQRFPYPILILNHTVLNKNTHTHTIAFTTGQFTHKVKITAGLVFNKIKAYSTNEKFAGQK